MLYKPTLKVMADIMTVALTGNLFHDCSTSYQDSLLSTFLLPTLVRKFFFYTLHQHLFSKTQTLKNSRLHHYNEVPYTTFPLLL